MNESTPKGMSNGRKLGIGCVVLALIGLGTCGGLAVWGAKAGLAVTEGFQRGLEEGTAFGGTTDQAGCLEAYDQKVAECGDGAPCFIGGQMFAGACFAVAEPTDGFCDQIPEDVEAWKLGGCADSTGDMDTACLMRRQAIISACEVDVPATP